MVELLLMSCCGMEWVGIERAHCFRRTRGCGRVFDDGALLDAHRRHGVCINPQDLGLVQTRNRIWLAPSTGPRKLSIGAQTRRRR